MTRSRVAANARGAAAADNAAAGGRLRNLAGLERIDCEWARDPLPKLKSRCAKLKIGDDQWSDLEREAAWQVDAAR